MGLEFADGCHASTDVRTRRHGTRPGAGLGLAMPPGDRVVEGLRIAREVGGGELGRLLRNLSGYLRDEARTRSEMESRQAWTVNSIQQLQP